jgi:nucleoid-associated protein EbfC
MFGNLLGDFEKKQQEMLDKAAEIVVTSKTEGVSVTVNGKKEIVNISIDPSVLTDKEQLEDLLIVSINRALEEAGEKAAAQAEELMQNMLPPGLGDLFKGGM